MHQPIASSEIPPQVADFHVEFEARGATGPFLGREAELERLAKMFVGVVQPPNVLSITGDSDTPNSGIEDPANPAKPLAILGAPGAGKSTLLMKAADLAQSLGLGVVHMNWNSFASTKNLRQALLRNEPWRSETIKHAARTESNLRRAKLKDSALQTIIGTVAGTVGLGNPTIDVAERLAHSNDVHSSRSDDPILVFEDIQRMYPHGFVLCVDEAHHWDKLIQNPVTRSCLLTVVGVLANPDERMKFNVPRGLLIVAGMNNTTEVLAELGSPRINEMPLAGLGVKATAELVSYHARCAPLDTEALTEVLHTWVPHLTNAYYMWAHHAYCAATACETVLQQFGTECVTQEWGLALIEREAQNGVSALYRLVRERAIKDVGATVTTGIAHALQLTGRPLFDEESLDILDTLHQADKVKEHRAYQTAVDIRSRLLHAGVLQKQAGPSQGEDTYCIPIPSFQTWLTNLPRTPAISRGFETVKRLNLSAS